MNHPYPFCSPPNIPSFAQLRLKAIMTMGMLCLALAFRPAATATAAENMTSPPHEVVDEPDDDFSTATQINLLPHAQAYEINPDTDVDYYRITLVAGEGYDFVNGSATNLDTRFWLYGPGTVSDCVACPVVAEDDDSAGGLQPRITYVPTVTGWYYLRVAFHTNEPTFAPGPSREVAGKATADPQTTGPYTLAITSFVPDNNDDPSSATQIDTLPHDTNYEVNPDGDVDWYRLDLGTGVSFTMSNSSATNFDTRFWLYGPGTASDCDACPLVAEDDDSGGNAQPLIEFSPTASGFYYLRVAFSFNAPPGAHPVVAPKKAGKQQAPATTGDYTLSVDAPLTINIKALLEGPYSGSGTMATSLNPVDLPLAHPYDGAAFSGTPMFYSGPETVTDWTGPKASAVDWVVVEIRTGTAGADSVTSAAGLLMSDGMVRDTSGTRLVSFGVASPGNYYVVVRHRNHLAAMTANAIPLIHGASALYDLTSASTQAFGNGVKDLGDGSSGLYAGDANANGQIQNDDKNLEWADQTGQAGYRSADWNLDGQVQNSDKNDLWQDNVGIGTAVPE